MVVDRNNFHEVIFGRKAKQPSATPGFDLTKYLPEVEGFDITEKQKQELLLILLSIMRSFVELGFNFDVCAALLSDETIPVDTELG